MQWVFHHLYALGSGFKGNEQCCNEWKQPLVTFVIVDLHLCFSFCHNTRNDLPHPLSLPVLRKADLRCIQTDGNRAKSVTSPWHLNCFTIKLTHCLPLSSLQFYSNFSFHEQVKRATQKINPCDPVQWKYFNQVIVSHSFTFWPSFLLSLKFFWNVMIFINFKLYRKCLMPCMYFFLFFFKFHSFSLHLRASYLHMTNIASWKQFWGFVCGAK